MAFFDFLRFFQPKHWRYFAAWEYDAFTHKPKWVYAHMPDRRMTDDEALEKFIDTQDLYQGGAYLWTFRDGDWQVDQNTGAFPSELAGPPGLGGPFDWFADLAKKGAEIAKPLLAPEPAKYTGGAVPMFCQIRQTADFQNLVAIVQGQLRARGELQELPESDVGRWTGATCKAWWKVMKEAPSESSMRKLVGDVLKPCPGVLVAVDCPKPFPWLLVGTAGAAAVGAGLYYRSRQR